MNSTDRALLTWLNGGPNRRLEVLGSQPAAKFVVFLSERDGWTASEAYGFSNKSLSEALAEALGKIAERRTA